MITPDKIAKSGSEHAIQSALFAALNFAMVHGFDEALLWANGEAFVANEDSDRLIVPELRWFHAVPNGGSRGDNAKSRAIRGAQLKAEGVKQGVADIFWPLPRTRYAGLYIEMKKPDGKASFEQVEFATYAIHHCYCWEMFDNWRDAFLFIRKYYEGEVK